MPPHVLQTRRSSGDGEEIREFRGDDFQAALDAARSELRVDRATPIVIDAEPRLSPDEREILRDSIQIDETARARSVETEDWLSDERGYVDYGLAEVNSPFRSADIFLILDGVLLEGLEIGSRVELLPTRQDDFWMQVWATFGYSNVDSRVGGYWGLRVGLVAPGVGAFARDEDEEGRIVELFELDEDDPAEVARLIRQGEDEFFDPEATIRPELLDTYTDGPGIRLVEYEDGHHFTLQLDVSEAVRAHL
jgi:hypothetical protein